MDKVKPAKNKDSSIHIILVDDDPVLLDTTKELLEMLGYSVTTANGGHEAIALMKRSIFDVVITDYDMHGMSGLQLALITRIVSVDTPIILCTGSIHLIDAQQMAGAGIAEVVRKPFKAKYLDFIIKKVMAEKKGTATP